MGTRSKNHGYLSPDNITVFKFPTPPHSLVVRDKKVRHNKHRRRGKRSKPR